MRAMIVLALITGARVGELLALRWEHVTDDALTFLETKNGKVRRIPLTPASKPSWSRWRVSHPYVFTNAGTEDRYTVNGVRHVFGRAVHPSRHRSGGRDAPHAATHGAQPDDRPGHRRLHRHGVSGHSSTRMLERYTHPTEARKVDALAAFGVVTNRSQPPNRQTSASELKELLGNLVDGGRIELPTSALRTRRSPS